MFDLILSTLNVPILICMLINLFTAFVLEWLSLWTDCYVIRFQAGRSIKKRLLSRTMSRTGIWCGNVRFCVLCGLTDVFVLAPDWVLSYLLVLTGMRRSKDFRGNRGVMSSIRGATGVEEQQEYHVSHQVLVYY